MFIPRQTRQQFQAQLEREQQDAELLKDYARLTARLQRDAIDRLLDVPDDEWQALVDADAEWEKRDTFQFEAAEAQPWEPILAQGSPVMRHVHFVTMQDDVAEQVTRGELTNIRAKAYEKELKLQGQAVGCPGYRARLGQSEEWVSMVEQSTAEARSITTTYNKDLAKQINKIRKDVPTANRNTYAKRLRDWGKKRRGWKNKQSEQFAANDARGKAQADFYNKNGIVEGYAILRPRTAVCPICKGWVNRGKVSINIAMAEPGLWHPGCPHLWDVTTAKLPPDGCANLWKPGGGPRMPRMPSVPVEPVVEPTQDNWTIVTKHPRSKQEFIPSDADVSLVNSTLDKVTRTVDVGDVEVVIGDVGGSDLGNVIGERLIKVNPTAVRKAIADSKIDDAAFTSWFDGTGRNYDELFEHTVAHESGHVWVNQKATREALADWVKIHDKQIDLMPVYGRSVDQPGESLADMFARFVLGRDMPPIVNDWFMENVK